MSIERAKEHMKKWGIDDRVLEFETSSATVELAAQAVGCEPARIAKIIVIQNRRRTDTDCHWRAMRK